LQNLSLTLPFLYLHHFLLYLLLSRLFPLSLPGLTQAPLSLSNFLTLSFLIPDALFLVFTQFYPILNLHAIARLLLIPDGKLPCVQNLRLLFPIALGLSVLGPFIAMLSTTSESIRLRGILMVLLNVLKPD
jgi:hypothetical protein